VVGRPLVEAELVGRAKRGDEAAYEELVKIHREVAFRTAYLIAGSAADAEEAAQDGFVKAYRALARFRDGLPFRPWLLQIVANEARNRRRAAGRREFLAVRAAAESVSGGAAPSPETEVLAAAERAELVRAIAGLREETGS
jgi:RNA polymerase sigma-70 factor (ECF subfamily)